LIFLLFKNKSWESLKIMDLKFDQEELAFQKEVKDFLKTELPAHLVSAAKKSSAVFPEKEVALEWQSILAKKGWLVPSWPEEYGGTNWNPAQKYIFARELAEAEAPSIIPMGLAMLGPVLLGYGTKEQKDYYLPRMISGEDYWCQGYSEPGSGSDLASLQCKAEVKDDKYIINGTKIWTTHAHYANKIFCLVRTDNQNKPQAGITFLMVDMDQPGIKVEPIITLAKDHDVNQVVFNNAEAKITDRIGEEGEGWTVAKYLLEFERGGGVVSARAFKAINFAKKLAENIKGDEGINLISSSEYLQKFADLEIRAQAVQYTELRGLSAMKDGGRPGPESSMMKNLGADLQQDISELALEIIGYYGNAFQDTSYGSNTIAIGHESYLTIAGSYQNLRAASVYGGSREVQKNIIAKAVLGL
jgi:acyl-CoA dehydrogenase